MGRMIVAMVLFIAVLVALLLWGHRRRSRASLAERRAMGEVVTFAEALGEFSDAVRQLGRSIGEALAPAALQTGRLLQDMARTLQGAEPHSLLLRLHQQIAREPHFNERGVLHGSYPHVADLGFAIEVLLEELEEQTYEEDPHAWCHRRPVLLALLDAVLDELTLSEVEELAR